MAPISPGNMSGPPRKPKKPTETTKAHRFEGFGKRIAKIKIDPVHTVQKTRVADDHADLSTSYFRSSLDEWAELNLSATFTSFLNKAQPLSESLPQLLHHSDAIFSLLHDHIAKQDVLALEPLLSLVAHLAHDLGSAFEKHFSSIVKLVSQVSASVEDPPSIEQCFTCLAWMFKYLSKLLVQDLRPLLEIMVPYFQSKKDYVRRFSAESLAFLLRKAAVMHAKKTKPLELALLYLFSKLEEKDGSELQSLKLALMTLLSESAIGVDASLHSSAVDLFMCIFSVVGKMSSDQERVLSVVDGVVVNLIHKTHAAGFRPLLELITQIATKTQGQATSYDKLSIGRLLDVTATRAGSRISDWRATIEALLAHTQSNNHNLIYDSELLTVSANILQYCPMDQLLPFARTIVDSVVARSGAAQFFAFCEMVSEFGESRFQDLLLPRLQQYLVSNWAGNEDGACYLSKQLRKSHTISAKLGEPGYLTFPKEWELHVLAVLKSAPLSTGFTEDHAKFFQLSQSIHFPKDSAVGTALQSLLESSLTNALDQQNVVFDASHRLTLGWAFKLLVSLSKHGQQPQWNDIAIRVLQCRPEYYQLVPFLEACLGVLQSAQLSKISGLDNGHIGLALCDNMLSESFELREKSLEVLLVLGKIQVNEWLVETSTLLLELIRIEYLHNSARSIAMLVRRMPRQQEASDPSSTLHKLVPLFGLGLLRHYHDQTRKELCSALGLIATKGNSEEIILDLTTQWLHRSGSIKPLETTQPVVDRPGRLSAFECSNRQSVQTFSSEAIERHSCAKDKLREEFEEAHLLRPATIPTESRVLALQVLLEIPDIAEKRSRALSPVFLSVQQGMANHHVPPSDESASSHTISPDFNDQPWSLHERKLFLELLGRFVNPRVLYRSRELYDHLLELLTNGNSDVRRLALLALLEWKDPALSQYRETLLRVAEEKNANTELALLLANDAETGSIEPQHRANVLPILLRLIFGQLVARGGTHGSQEAKRKSILKLLFRMEKREVIIFLKIALGRLGELSFIDQANLPVNVFGRDVLSQDQQYGFLRMMLSVQEILQNNFAPFGKVIVDAVTYCVARACHQINRTLIDDAESSSVPALVKNIRRCGLQCLTTIFELSEDITWKDYLPVLFEKAIDPRVPKFSIEFAQGISGLLRLFSTWSKSSRLVYLLKQNSQLSGKLWEIISIPSARDDVKRYVLDEILMPLLEISREIGFDHNSAKEILESDIDGLLNSFVGLLQRQPAKDLLLSATRAIQPLAPFAVSSNSANEVLNLLITLICEPAQRIPPHVKGQLLSATESLLRSHHESIATATKLRLYDVVASLFNYFKDQPNRSTLGDLLSALAGDDQDMKMTVKICQDMNAASIKHLDEIDFERQLSAYTAVNSLPSIGMTSRQWLPILYNLIYFARTADDFAIRSNAVSGLKRFITQSCQSQEVELQRCIKNVLLPVLKKGNKEDSELIRADFVAMYGLIVGNLPDAPELEDMRVLLVGNDEEASFFTNILHIQQHRRIRAIRRLLTEVEKGAIQPANISDFFLPLLDKFISDEGDDESMQGVKGQSIVAVSTLLQWIDWKSFRMLFRQYKSDLDNAARPEKEAIKLLSNAADALTLAVMGAVEDKLDIETQPQLSKTLPSTAVLSNELKANFIPRLSKFIHHKDEAEISLRIPAAKVAVKLIKLLPAEEISLLVAPIILDISQILRSRAQESRDIARNTLAEIALLLGPSSIQFMLKEMRTTLTRGYQLHVLSYTLHTILLQTTECREPGGLDYCLDDLVSVVMDDIFGIVGQEKENQDYISSMKEVKSSKSQDSMELLAKASSVQVMRKLLKPFQSLLAGNLTTRQVRQVDELLRRIGVGISHNPAASSRDLLVFAYELIQAFYQQRVAKSEPVLTNDQKNRKRFLIQMKSAHEATNSISSSLQYKIARFALDLVRSTLVKNTALLTPENVYGFLPIIGDSLVEAQEDVRMSAFRLLSAIVKLPLPELDRNASLYVMEAVKVVRGAIHTNEESSQAALKLVSAILRERKDVKVRDSDVAYLLQRTMPDIEEPDRQGVTFNFVKAVMARQYQLPEVYELMDKIAVMMVTNQTRSARDMARGVYVHFLLEYPQSTNRWTKQLRFLVRNLEYDFREGRQSAMEAVHVLLQKLRAEALQEVVATFFIPAVLRMANDDDPGCREMAGALLAKLFRVADKSQMVTLLEPLRGWLEQTDNLPLVKVSLQAWSVYFENVPDSSEAEIPAVRKCIAQALKNDRANEDDWAVQYQALELFSKLTSTHPATVISPGQANIWTSIRHLLSSAQEWTQISAAGLVGMYFQSCTENGKAYRIPLEGGYGLCFDAEAVLAILRGSLRTLKHNEGNLNLAQKTMQNLAFLSNYIATADLSYQIKVKSSVSGPIHRPDATSEAGSDAEGDSDSDEVTTSIPAIQYLFDQLTAILRREPSRLSTATFTPRASALSLLSNIITQLSLDSIPGTSLTSLMIPLTYITDPSLQAPRSADPTFSTTYQSYIESAQTLQETIQHKVGDAVYVKMMTDVSKIIRERRGERRTKRAIDRVAEPERAEREKKRKKDMKARRKKSVVDIHRKRRRGDLGF